MDKSIRDCTERLIETIRNSEDYKNYRRSEDALKQFPGLVDEIMELRKKTIEFYHDPEADGFLENTDQLGAEYERLEKIPEVNSFLEAEEGLVHILKEISTSVVNSMELRVPNI